MSLALFDLDNTLLRGDSDHAWCEFLVDRGVLEGEAYREATGALAAIEELEKNSGAQFDPNVVGALLDVIDHARVVS